MAANTRVVGHFARHSPTVLKLMMKKAAGIGHGKWASGGVFTRSPLGGEELMFGAAY